MKNKLTLYNRLVGIGLVMSIFFYTTFLILGFKDISFDRTYFLLAGGIVHLVSSVGQLIVSKKYRNLNQTTN